MDTEHDPDTGSNLLASPVQASRPPHACLHKPKAPWGSAALGDTHAHCWLHRLSAPLNILRLPPNDPPGSAHATAARNGRSRHRDTSAGRRSSPRAPLGLHRPHPPPHRARSRRPGPRAPRAGPCHRPVSRAGGARGSLQHPQTTVRGAARKPPAAAGTVTMTLLPLSPAQGCAPLSCGPRGSEAPPAPGRRVPGSTGGRVLTVPAGPAVAQDFSSDSATYLSANVKGSNFYQNYSSYFCLFFFCVKGAF